MKIDKDLLRKRAEHNDGELSSLEEITLHQFDIEKIEKLDVFCKNLRILLLQNNQIPKIGKLDATRLIIENLHKLKQLQYLNLALNNIQRIENLQKCESLQKLDLTVNFIENLLDVETLVENEFLKELFLVGNPCYNVEGYRQFVIATLPQLKFLDGIEIQKSERIEAAQAVGGIRARLVQEWKDKQIVPPEYPPEDPNDTDLTEEELEKKRQEFQTKLVGHTPEARLQAARDLAKFKKTDQNTQPKPQTPPEPMFAADGRILQRNQGKWPFHLTDTPETVVLDVEISKFMDSSFIDVDVHPHWIRVVIKNKVLQLNLDDEVSTSDVMCERSKLTGRLVITMLKVKARGKDVAELVAIAKKKNSEPIVKETKPQKSRNRRYERLFDPTQAVDIKNIVDHEKLQDSSNIHLPVSLPLKDMKIRDEKFLKTDIKIDADFVDDPDVPPLC